MPKTYMGKTEEKRVAARYERLRNCIGKRVVCAMHESKLTQEQLARSFSMGHGTVRKITDGEDVTLTTTKFLQILDLAGLMLVDKKKDELEAAQ